ncbi:MAG TPA: adenylate/guanylate cyclase domain-containing protein [Burkholderiales bacterium]|nr:adenylate/guanylate cyclase domain-containing protein [Burkholderiales bacterium]
MANPLLGNLKRTIICSVMFVDIVEYSKKTVAKQLAFKGWLNELLSQALHNVSPADRIIVDTGDGAAICLPGDPEEALFIANSVRVTLLDQNFPEFQLRIGIHLGPVKVIKDINGRPNVIGDGINVAQRVMSFAAPNQILVSRSYYDVVSCLSEEYAQLFRYHGIHKDKHVREHEVYEVNISGPGNVVAKESQSLQETPSEEPVEAIVESAPLEGNFDDQLLSALTKLLSRHVGPIAALMVKRAAKKAADTQELARMLAESIPVPDLRMVFREEVSAKIAGTKLPARSAETPATDDQAIPAARGSNAMPTAVNEETLSRVEHLLVQYIGPMARILVRKSAKNIHDADELVAALAQTIESERDRAAFLAAAQKSLSHF